VSGSRFAYCKGDVALVELALCRFALDRLGGKGFEAVLRPVLVREDATSGCSRRRRRSSRSSTSPTG
jgi:seryl-tRNA synthetase